MVKQIDVYNNKGLSESFALEVSQGLKEEKVFELVEDILEANGIDLHTREIRKDIDVLEEMEKLQEREQALTVIDAPTSLTGYAKYTRSFQQSFRGIYES